MKKSGFTLIECLVAVLILAIVLASSTRAIGLAIDDVKDSYTREAAAWIASNQQSQFFLDGVYPEMGTTTLDAKMAGIDFTVMTNVSATANPYFRRIEVEVATKKNPKYKIYHTVNFISQF